MTQLEEVYVTVFGGSGNCPSTMSFDSANRLLSDVLDDVKRHDETKAIHARDCRERYQNYRKMVGLYEAQEDEEKKLEDKKSVDEAKKLYDDKKAELPLIYFSGRFAGRGNKHLIEHSGFVLVDIDGKEQTDPMMFRSAAARMGWKTKIADLPWVQGVFTSPSGEGLKVLVRMSKPDAHDVDKAAGIHKATYRAIADNFLDDMGLVVDMTCCNVGRGNFLPYDPEMILKDGEVDCFPEVMIEEPEKEVEELVEPGEHGTVKRVPEDDFFNDHDLAMDSKTVSSPVATITKKKPGSNAIVDRIYKECVAKGVSLTAKYPDWIKVGIVLKRAFSASYGLQMFLKFSAMDTCYTEDEARKVWNGIDADDRVDGVGLPSLLWLAREKGIDAANPLKDIDQLEMWLLAHYRFRLNDLNASVTWGEVEGEIPAKVFSWDFDMASLAREAERVLGFAVSDTKLDRVIRDCANQNRYNPIETFIKNLKWDGVDRFEDLFQSIQTDDPGGFRMYFRKWFVNIVATALGKDINDKVLVLQGDQGSGKTFFLENLLPSVPGWELTETAIKFDPNNKDDLVLAGTRMLIVLDEFTCYSKGELSSLKAFHSSKGVTIRLPYGRDYVWRPKIASCCGCVNEDRFLRDATGDRRYLVYAVVKRDKNLFDSINKEQLLAQAVHEYESGFDYKLSELEYFEIIERNRENFTSETTDDMMLNEYLYPSKTEFFTMAQIVSELKNRHGHHFSSATTRLGRSLSNMGIHSSVKRVYGKTTRVYGCSFSPEIEGPEVIL